MVSSSSRSTVLLQVLFLLSQGINVFGLLSHAKKQVLRSSMLDDGITDVDDCREDRVQNGTDSKVRIQSFWRGKGEGSKWEERVQIQDLSVGQKLSGYVAQDLLGGKTGPKVFFECGVSRISKNGKWSIVHGMLRLPRSKLSVAKKRASRLRKKAEVELFVSRIQVECGRLEVCGTLEEAEKFKVVENKRSVSSLSVNEEVTGVVVKLLPYGVMVDVGANRLGLLHIKKVSELYGRYIDKEIGLAAAGLERGAKLRLSVASIEKRRLSLQFTEDVTGVSDDKSTSSSTTSGIMSKTELEEWAAYAADAQPQVLVTDEEENHNEEDDDFDEDREIEDSLGLGFY